jgi:hypothetical protein
MYNFLNDLDAFFCEKYANYDKLCILPGYKMPKMQDSKVDEYGRVYAYTLPADTMRLALQENMDELLKALKEKMVDKTFSFSFAPLSFFARIKNKTSKKAFLYQFKKVLAAHALSFDEAGAELEVDSGIWKNICKGNFLPTKNLIFSLALTAHLSLEETEWLLASVGYEWDYAVEKDVVITYLLHAKVYNAHMIQEALAEYKIGNMYFKEETEK